MAKSLTVSTAKVSDGATTEDDSPSKMSYDEGQSPVRQMPKTFQKQKSSQFKGINLTAMNKDVLSDEEDDAKDLN